MTIRIGQNTASLRAQRLLATHREAQAGAFERLSSGLRINNAGDDAAGLAISSELSLRSRVTGQGLRNLNDGLSALSIADSAIQTLQGILSRQRELATQAASGSISSEQRAALDDEYQALAQEYSRVIATTKFNGERLLDGSRQGITLQAGGDNRAAAPWSRIGAVGIHETPAR